MDAEWVQLAKLTATPGERVSIDIPVEFLDKVAYPTNFVKQISGEQVNVYHSIHVMRLRQLADASGTEELRDWADLWEGYICRWAGMKLYDDYKARDYKAVGEQLIDPQEVCSRLE